MKRIKIWILTILVMVMSVPMTSTSFAAVKDYATLECEVTLDPGDNPNNVGTIKVTLTGVVGQQIDKDHVNFAMLPEAYYYRGYPSIGHPDHSPNQEAYEKGGDFPITGHHIVLSHTESIVVSRDKLTETFIELGEARGGPKVPLKLIPVVEGSKMTITLGSGTNYFSNELRWDHAFKGTNPLVTTRGGKAIYYQMWAGDKAQSYTFKKTTNDEGTFRIYTFPSMYLNLVGDIAFYVVTEAEAKALMANPNNLPTEMRPISITATPTASKVLVNERAVSFEAYNIKGNNYFKLRDLAKVVSGTDKQFAVGYDNGTSAITLTSGDPYTIVGGELSNGAGKAKPAVPTTSKIYVNGNETPFTAYNIGGNNYFKLRDVAEAFNIGVGYDNATKVITIDTKLDYEAPPVR